MSRDRSRDGSGASHRRCTSDRTDRHSVVRSRCQLKSLLCAALQGTCRCCMSMSRLHPLVGRTAADHRSASCPDPNALGFRVQAPLCLDDHGMHIAIPPVAAVFHSLNTLCYFLPLSMLRLRGAHQESAVRCSLLGAPAVSDPKPHLCTHKACTSTSRRMQLSSTLPGGYTSWATSPGPASMPSSFCEFCTGHAYRHPTGRSDLLLCRAAAGQRQDPGAERRPPREDARCGLDCAAGRRSAAKRGTVDITTLPVAVFRKFLSDYIVQWSELCSRAMGRRQKRCSAVFSILQFSFLQRRRLSCKLVGLVCVGRCGCWLPCMCLATGDHGALSVQLSRACRGHAFEMTQECSSLTQRPSWAAADCRQLCLCGGGFILLLAFFTAENG